MDDKFEIKSIDDFNSLLIIAESGNTKAMNEIAFHYENGIHIDNIEILKADQQLAFNWTKKAYEQGDIEAIEKYADYLSDGEYTFCEKNNELAMNLYKKAMEAGSNRATHCLGLEYRNKQNFEKAFELYEKSQSSKDFYQELSIGLCYYYGVGTKKDRLKALELFKKIEPEVNSQYEIDEANYLIGKIYLEGEVVEQSLELARQHLELADKDGDHRSAQELLIIIGRTKMIN